MDAVCAGSMNGPEAQILSLLLPRGCDRRSLDSDWDDRPILNAASDMPAAAGQRTREDGSPARNGRRNVQRDAG